MFHLARLTDIIKLEPHTFVSASLEALESQINAKYSNRVLLNVGLCLIVFDFIHVGDSMIGQGDGAAYTHGSLVRKTCINGS